MTDATLYDTKEGVEHYAAMAKGYDGRIHIERLNQLLAPGSEVLELGMGPGVDLDLLAKSFTVVGSDRSRAFLDRYARRHADAEVLRLDAVTIDTTKRFDCIYSNKVLHHLTVEELTRSLRRQAEVIRPNGLLLHGLWSGDATENHHGLHSQQYTAETFAAAMPPTLEIVECTPYQEMTPDDSIRVVLRPSPKPRDA